MIIELPWPSATLSPNSRVHWRTKAGATKSAKNTAWVLTKEAMFRAAIKSGVMAGPIGLAITFHPKQDRNRDLDNCQAMMKAALDGIALALGVNDTHFRPVSTIGDKRTPACVVVTLTPSLIDVPVIGVIS